MSGAPGAARRLWALHGPTITVSTGEMIVGGDEMVTIPIPCFVVQHERGLVLFDTGLDPAAVGDPRMAYGELADAVAIDFPPEQDLATQLAAIGFALTDVTHVVLSHTHLDHTGGLSLFPHAALYVGTGELQYAFWPDALDAGNFRRSDLEATRGYDWHQLDGDFDLFGDGSVVILHLPGHSPGNQGLLVRLPSRTFLIAGDTVHLRAALDLALPTPRDYSNLAARRSIERLVHLRDSLGATVWIGHDREDAAEFSFAPESYE